MKSLWFHSRLEPLKVYIPASGAGNIQKIDAQPVMFNDDAEIVSLSAPQLVAYDLGPNRPDPVISRIGDPRRVGGKATKPQWLRYKITKGGARPKVDCYCSVSLGDGGPMVGSSKHKHFTERDQRLYSTLFFFWVEFLLLTVRNVAKFQWKLGDHN